MNRLVEIVNKQLDLNHVSLHQDLEDLINKSGQGSEQKSKNVIDLLERIAIKNMAKELWAGIIQNNQNNNE